MKLSKLSGLIFGAGLLGIASAFCILPQPKPERAIIPQFNCEMVRGVLPDPLCTPGIRNPAVTQDNLYSTICLPGWTKTVRPPSSYTSSLKRQQMAAYGFTDNPRFYEEDHLIPLELGGDPRNPLNLWPEPGASPNAKDRIENHLNDLVCTYKMSLEEAQQRIAFDWTKADP